MQKKTLTMSVSSMGRIIKAILTTSKSKLRKRKGEIDGEFPITKIASAPSLTPTAQDDIRNAQMHISENERARLEYEYANHRWTNGTSQRRSGLAFFTAVQGTLLTIIGDRMTTLDSSGWALVIFGLIVTVIAWNHERRIGAYMEGYQKRAIEIEDANGMMLIRKGRESARSKRTISNRIMFAWYFIAMGLGWIIIIVYNIYASYGTE